MAARTKSKVTPKYKTKYRLTNWSAYEASMRQRGDIMVWFDEGVIDAWNSPPSGRPGGQPQFTDLAIRTALTLRTVFHLALRQTEGFVASLIRLMDLDLKTPTRCGAPHDALPAVRDGHGAAATVEAVSPNPPDHRLDRPEDGR